MAPEGSVFVYNARGLVERGEGFEGDDLCVNYCYTFGQDWHMVSGLTEGISQITRQSQGHGRCFVWNFPLDATFTSTNPYGWPQLVLNVYGKDFFGTDIVRGYAATHLPITPGEHTCRLSCFVPTSASLLQRLASWITGNTPEFLDPKMVAQARGREVTRVESQGHITVALTVTIKDYGKLGYDCGVSSLGSLSARSLLAAALDTSGSNNRPARSERESSRAGGRGKSSTTKGRQKSDESNDAADQRGKQGSQGVDDEARVDRPGPSSRGLFAKYPAGSSNKEGKVSKRLVIVEGGKGEEQDQNFGVAGTSETKKHVNISEPKKDTIERCDDTDEEDSNFDSDASDNSSNQSGVTPKSREGDKSKSSKQSNNAGKGKSSTPSGIAIRRHKTSEPTGKSAERKYNETSTKTNIGNARRFSETGVNFSRESGVTFLGSERHDSKPRKVKASSPLKNTRIGLLSESNGDDSGNGRQRASSADILELPTSDSSRSRKRSGGISPFQDGNSSGIGSDGGGGGVSSVRANLFGMTRAEEPLPLPRKSILQPIGARAPLPGIGK